MITKLKYLVDHYDRIIVPATGQTIGKIFYTSKVNPVTNRRTQYVIDLDAKTIVNQTINPTGDPATQPGASVISTNIAPSNDINLYIYNNVGTDDDAYPIVTAMDAIVPVTLGVQKVDDLCTHVLRNGIVTTVAKVAFVNQTSSPAGFTFNAGAGTMTVATTVTAGAYAFNYLVYDKADSNNPTAFTVTYNVA